MELTERISEGCVIADIKSSEKNEVLNELVDNAFRNGKIHDAGTALSALLERESLGSTGVGEQVAIPHAKLPDIEDIIIILGISSSGIEFNASDGDAVRLFFVLLSPEKQMNLHLKTLAKISRLIKLTGFKKRVLERPLNAEDIIAILREEEAALG